MVHINYPVLNKTESDSIKKELEERHRHVQWGSNGILDFDLLIQNQRGVMLVEQLYLHEINRFRNSRQDVSYMVFFNKGTYPITGIILTDCINEDKSIKSVSEEVSMNRGNIKLVLAYSIGKDLEQRLREDLIKKGTELKVLFQDKR